LNFEGKGTVKIESWVASEEKARWKIVRRDDYRDLQGDILTADENTGECSLSVLKPDKSGYDTVTYTLDCGIAIVPRGR
jgi:hypothetical protein